MATHSSILAWTIPMDREAWWATVHGVAKSQTQPGDWTHTHEEGGTGGITAVPTPLSGHQGSEDMVGYSSNGRSHSFLSGGFLGIWNFLEKSLLTIWYYNVEFIVLLPWGNWHSWVSPLLKNSFIAAHHFKAHSVFSVAMLYMWCWDHFM